MCGSMADIQSAAAEIRRGKKKKKKEEQTRGRKYIWFAPLHRADHKKYSILLGYVCSTIETAGQA